MLFKISRPRSLVAALCLAFFASYLSLSHVLADTENTGTKESSETSKRSSRASAIFAGGCFWCVETDFEKVPGVTDVISGYSGGRNKEPTYENYALGGHREVVFVLYDPSEITFAGLVEYFLKHTDPTDRRGQFIDKGLQYSPAIYFENEQEKSEAERVIKAIDEMHVLRGKISIALEPRVAFWPAEAAHQDFHHKNMVKYSIYREQCGRDAFVAQHWGPRAMKLELPGAYPEGKSPEEILESVERPAPKPWLTFRKPSAAALKKKLTAIQYQVTQQDGTELAYRNSYWNNKKDGIYVDVVSGAPLFSSLAKYESGTGWPSFVEPIFADALIYRTDRKLGVPRVEVRSRYGDSHLGHVFSDGPASRGGKRYCMNSAALRFVPKEEMEAAGYAEYLPLFDGKSEHK